MGGSNVRGSKTAGLVAYATSAIYHPLPFFIIVPIGADTVSVCRSFSPPLSSPFWSPAVPVRPSMATPVGRATHNAVVVSASATRRCGARPTGWRVWPRLSAASKSAIANTRGRTAGRPARGTCGRDAHGRDAATHRRDAAAA